MMFVASVEKAVKRVSGWSPAYYVHLNAYYKLATSPHAASLPGIKIAKPTSQTEARKLKYKGMG